MPGVGGVVNSHPTRGWATGCEGAAQPPDPVSWNRLAEAEGNLFQSSYYDDVEGYYGTVPRYFTIHRDGALIAGVRLLEWSSPKLRPLTVRLSRSLMQMGESLVDRSVDDQSSICDSLHEAVGRYLCSSRAVSYRAKGFYGGPGLIRPIAATPQSETRFNIATWDLRPTEDELWARLHSKHRNTIRKAESHGIVVVEEPDNLEAFMELFRATYYVGNPATMPNLDYIRHLYQVLHGSRHASLWFAKRNGAYLSGALVTYLGATGYYAFGGSSKDRAGSGELLHWEVAKLLKRRGLSQYVLGGVAPSVDEDDLKFSVGISRFKRRFGVVESESSSAFYVQRPVEYQMWNTLVQVRMALKRSGPAGPSSREPPPKRSA